MFLLFHFTSVFMATGITVADTPHCRCRSFGPNKEDMYSLVTVLEATLRTADAVVLDQTKRICTL